MKRIFLLIVISACFNQEKALAQQSNLNHSVYQVFQTFFENEIKHQGIKGDWIFKLKEISGTHKFDYKTNKLQDVLIEFTAIPIDGEGLAQFYTVFIEQYEKDFYKQTAFFESEDLNFLYENEGVFHFKNLVNNKVEEKTIGKNNFISH